jgi:hypothetical protein
LLIIKVFQIDQRNRERILSIVTQVLLDKFLTFAEARMIIEQQVLEYDYLITKDTDMVVEFPCKSNDDDNFDLLDAERNKLDDI